MLIQTERDRLAGLNTARFGRGDRDPQLGAVDAQMDWVGNVLAEADVTFQRGLNKGYACVNGSCPSFVT